MLVNSTNLAAKLRESVLQDKTWALRCGEVASSVVGPIQALALGRPDITVSVIPAEAVPMCSVVDSVMVQESRKAFSVDRLAGEGIGGALNHGSGNTILWNDDGKEYFVSASPAWETTWTHVRFLLRHLFIARTIQHPRFNCMHAVVAQIGRQTDLGVAVVGATLSGKSRLMNRLIVGGALYQCIEDDCPIIDDQGTVVSLIPTQHEVRRPQVIKLAGMIILDPDCQQPREVGVAEASAFAAQCPSPWPATWLPGATQRPEDLRLPDSLRAMALPVRSNSDDGVVEEAASFVKSLAGDLAPAR